MGKIISSGMIEVNGEQINYEYRKGERLPNSTEWNCYIEAYYHGNHISIDDHGGGEQCAINMLRNEIAIQNSNKNRKSNIH